MFRSRFLSILSACAILGSQLFAQQAAQSVLGFKDFAQQQQWNKKFLAVPDAKLAEEHLRILTKAPHMAGTPEDRATAEYVAEKFRQAGLETEIVEYKIWINYPKSISVDVTAPANVKMHGPSKEQVMGDPFQDDPRVATAFNGMSPSGDVEAEVFYANYGRPEDFKKLKELGVDPRGKIALVRYGQNFRGVKTYVAQEYGCAGVIIYSDPMDDGYFKGDSYPNGPWRPASAVQRGSLAFMFKYPGDVTTPGIASLPDLPESQRTKPENAAAMPKIPTTPLPYQDASPILANLGGKASPREWQGALPFTYHVGPGPVKVHLNLQQDYQYRSIWDVIGRIRGTEFPDEWVVAGNHRDAWVYGAVDPNSGTAAMLETVHGIGELLKQGWKPKRSIVIGSWDAEEEGLIGSTEWGEQHEKDLAKAAAYFNMDVAVSGPNFGSSAVPTLKQFVREVAKQVPDAKGNGTVYDVWRKTLLASTNSADLGGSQIRPPNAQQNDVPVGDLGSGSDYTVFLQRLGVPANDIGSNGDYGVYHSVFDNFNWFKKFGDPDFLYTQQMARVFGIEVLHMADADVLPFDYSDYGNEIGQYIEAAQKKAAAQTSSPSGSANPAPTNPSGTGPAVSSSPVSSSPVRSSAMSATASATPLDFTAAAAAAKRFAAAGRKISTAQHDPRLSTSDLAKLNDALRNAERALLIPEGLPNRPWFRHAIYAPGEYTGYAAVVIPGVNEAIDANDYARAQKQLVVLAATINRAAQVLESFPGH